MKNKIYGEVYYEKIDICDEKVYFKSDEFHNDICWPQLRLWLAGRNIISRATQFPTRTPVVSPNPNSIWNISTSSYDIHQSLLNVKFPDETTTPATEGYPIWIPKTLPMEKDYMVVVVDLTPPTIGNTRTIKSIGLSPYYNGASSVFPLTDSFLTNLVLTTPCIQDDSTVIRITYRLYFDDYASTANTNISDGYYYYIKDTFKTLSDGTYTDGTELSQRIIDGVYSSSFYNVDALETSTVKGIASLNSNSSYCTDVSLVKTISSADRLHYSNGMVLTTSESYPLTDSYSSGVFFRKITISNDNSSGGLLTPFVYQNVLNSSYSPLQNVFKHKLNTAAPFQTLNASEMSTMTGNISIDTTSWVSQKYPKLFKVLITSSGDVGTATYKLETIDFTGGFLGNSFCPRTALLPQDPIDTKEYNYHRKSNDETNVLNSVVSGGTSIRTPDDTKYFVAVSCARTVGAFAVYNIETGSKKIYNSTNTPSYTATATSDMDVSGGFTFITCANTGLWKINSNFTSFTRITVSGVDDTKAYQICTKTDGSIWVMFEGGLASSSDLGTSWTIYNTTSSPSFISTGITDSNWSAVHSMIIDPDHIDDRFLFITSTGTTSNSYASHYTWWSRTFAATKATTGAGTGSIATGNILNASDDVKCVGGRWLINQNKDDYTTSTGTDNRLYTVGFSQANMSTAIITATGFQVPSVIPCTINGISGFMLKCARNSTATTIPSYFIRSSNVPTASVTLTPTSGIVEFSLRYGVSPLTTDMRTFSSGNVSSVGWLQSPIAYAKNSNMILSFERGASNSVNGFGVTPFILPPSNANYSTYKAAFVKSYGWNSGTSAWELNNANSKTIHSSSDLLIDGLNVSFSNGATSPNFINTDYFTFVVGDGVMKDNATSYTYNLPLYPENVEKISTFSSSTVPASVLGSLTNEPLTFSITTPNANGGALYFDLVQNKGEVSCRSHTRVMISDQLIPSSTQFTVKFKFKNLFATTTAGKKIGLVTYTSGITYAYVLYARVESTGAVGIYNVSNTLLATIPANLISIATEFSFVRTVANTIQVYYDTNLVYTSAANTSQFAVRIESGSSTPANSDMGFYDMKITYTENRYIVRIGDIGTSTGSYNSKFMGTTISGLLNDESLTLNGIAQTIQHKSSGESITTGEVKIATGAGWVIFNSADIGKTIAGYFVCHYRP